MTTVSEDVSLKENNVFNALHQKAYTKTPTSVLNSNYHMQIKNKYGIVFTHCI